MLSTSGSTGSPKLVKLSHENLRSNAESIAEYLCLASGERAITSLPLHYSYGLSVLHSHLLLGHAIVLTAESVSDPIFWQQVDRFGVTSIAGVPYSYELMAHSGFFDRRHPSLRYMTQAGGKLSEDLIVKFARHANSNDRRFYVMYGQTEASPRMAYLPPRQAVSHPDCIGVAIPGGKFRIDPFDGADHGAGELIYSGPNVMMGYALKRDDLGAPANVPELRTGDVARLEPDGLYKIVGRMSRFIKLFGLRIGLDDVETRLAERGIAVTAAGDDQGLVVACTQSGRKAEIADFLTQDLKLPPSSFSIAEVAEIPRLVSGKTDYRGIVALRPAPADETAPSDEKPAAAVLEAFVATFGERARDEAASFNSLGGDSLNFVQMITALERPIPNLPPDWGDRSIGSLAALAAEQQSEVSPSAPRHRYIPSNLDTTRGIACILVIALHVVGVGDTDGLRLPLDSPWHAAMNTLDLIRMPLFIGLSGFLYGALPARKGLGEFMQRKFSQLLIPLIFATLAFWVIRRVTLGSGDDLAEAYYSGYRHLWYIDSLLLVFAAVAAIDIYLKPKLGTWIAVLAILAGTVWLVPKLPILHTREALHLMPFFIFGVLIYRYDAILKANISLVAALLGCVGVMGLQVLQPSLYDALNRFAWLELACGLGAIVVALRLIPNMPFFEKIAPYSFTIYLWHPALTAPTRDVLQLIGVRAIPVYFVLGLAAGITAPIVMHVILRRFPLWVRLPFIGRTT